MNVANVVFSFENGGIENLLVDILNNWPEGEKIILCIVNDLKNNKLISKIKKRKDVEVYTIDRRPGSGLFSTLKSFIKLAHIIKKNKIDVIHCHSSSVFKYSLPLKLFNPKLKFYLTIHNTNSYSKISEIDLKFQKKYLNKIFAISNSVSDVIQKRGFPNEKIQLIYNGVDYKKFNIRNVKKNKKKIIICVARLIPRIKGQDILIKSMLELRKIRDDFECYIVGSAPKEHLEYRDELIELIQKLKLENYVKLLGNRDDVPELLVNSDVFVLPSRYEGFGISIIEAMYSKTIVVVSDIEGPKEIVKNNEYGYLFKVDDYKELSTLINNALSNNNEDIINKAYKYAINNYSVESMVKKLIKYYNS